MTDHNREEPSPLWCANDAPHEPHGEHNEFGGWNHCTGRPEQAHTPTTSTDDERQALAVIVAYTEDDYQREHGTLGGSAVAVADAILAAGFRRTVQGEPTTAAEGTGQPTNHEEPR